MLAVAFSSGDKTDIYLVSYNDVPFSIYLTNVVNFSNNHSLTVLASSFQFIRSVMFMTHCFNNILSER